MFARKDLAALRSAVEIITPILAQKSVKVTQRGMDAYVRYDNRGIPETINVPYLPDDAPENLIRAIQGFIDHEVGHVLDTDFNVLASAKKEWTKTARSESEQTFLVSIHNIIEDIYIEKCQTKRFRGSGVNLGNAGQFYLDALTKPSLAKLDADTESKESDYIGTLMFAIVRAWGGQSTFENFMRDYWGKVPQLSSRIPQSLRDEIRAVRSSADAVVLTRKFHSAVRDLFDPPPPPPPPPSAPNDEESDQDDQDDAEQQPGQGQSGAQDQDHDDDNHNQDDREGQGQDQADDHGGSDEESQDGDPNKAESDEEQQGGPQEDQGSDKNDDGGSENGDQDETSEEDQSRDEHDDEPQDEDDSGDQDGNQEGEDPEDGDPQEGNGQDSDQDDDQESDNQEGQGHAGEGEGEPEESDPSEGEHGSGNAMENGGLMSEIDDKDFGKLLGEAIAQMTGSIPMEDYPIYSTEEDFYDIWNPKRPCPDSLSTMVEKVDSMIGTMARTLERTIKAKGLARWAPGYRRGRMDKRAISRIALTKTHPELHTDKVFSQKEMSVTNDVAVSIVVDLSSSMQGQLVETALYSAYGLAATLDRLKISCEVVGFTTKDYSTNLMDEFVKTFNKGQYHYSGYRLEALYNPILKEFGERMNPRVSERFSSYPNEGAFGYTILGESVQKIHDRLIQRPENGKVMIVLTDGIPCGAGWADYVSHAKKVIDGIEKDSPVDIFGVGIQYDVDWLFQHSATIQNVSELPGTLMRHLTTSVLSKIHR